jgi:hypothetical protein
MKISYLPDEVINQAIFVSSKYPISLLKNYPIFFENPNRLQKKIVPPTCCITKSITGEQKKINPAGRGIFLFHPGTWN